MAEGAFIEERIAEREEKQQLKSCDNNELLVSKGRRERDRLVIDCNTTGDMREPVARDIATFCCHVRHDCAPAEAVRSGRRAAEKERGIYAISLLCFQFATF